MFDGRMLCCVYSSICQSNHIITEPNRPFSTTPPPPSVLYLTAPSYPCLFVETRPALPSKTNTKNVSWLAWQEKDETCAVFASFELRCIEIANTLSSVSIHRCGGCPVVETKKTSGFYTNSTDYSGNDCAKMCGSYQREEPRSDVHYLCNQMLSCIQRFHHLSFSQFLSPLSFSSPSK